MASDRLIKQFHLRVKTELDALKEVLQWFEGIIVPFLPQKLSWQCEIALVEAFTNAVRHAHHNLPNNTPIDLEVKFFSDCLEMCIWDRGKPFDLKAKLQDILNNQTPPLEQEGGRGLQFMNNLTDELQYFNLPDRRNCLVMRKKYVSSSVTPPFKQTECTAARRQ